MRILLRLLAVMVIVIQLGGASCYKVADDGLVQQVPGYGYVVKFTGRRTGPEKGRRHAGLRAWPGRRARGGMTIPTPCGITRP